MAKVIKAANHQLASEMQAMGFRFVFLPKDKVECRGRLSAAQKFLEMYPKLSWSRIDNRTRARHTVESEDTNFTGGSQESLVANLAGKINLRPFQAAKERFSESEVGKRIKESYRDCQPRRQRVLSEYDGEFISDRRWDIAPYQGVTKVMGPGRCLEIVADMNFNCGARSEKMNDYGCLVWALSDLLEGLGINVGVTLRYSTENPIEQSASSHTDIQIEAKKPGEYLAPSLLATACQSNFFRRVIFGLDCACPDLLAKEVKMGLGRATSRSGIAFADGVITMSPDCADAGYGAIEKVLMKAIG